MHVSQFKNFTLLFSFRRKELLQLRQLLRISLFGSLLPDNFADLHHGDIALVVSGKGLFAVLFEEGNGQVILPQQKVALGPRQHQLVVIFLLRPVAEGRQAVLVGAVLEQEVSCIFVDVLVFGSQGDVPLQIQEGLVRVPLNLQALRSLKVRFRVFFIQVDGYCEVLDWLAEVSEDSEDESPQIEVLGDVVFALFDGLVDIGHCLVEVVAVEMEDGPEVVEAGDVVVAELGEMGNSDGQIFDGFF